jgi:hypothetical protein
MCMFSMCTLCLVGVSKATPCVLWRDRYDTQGAGFGALQVGVSCVLWRDRYDTQGAGFGALQVVSELRFCRYPRV